MFRYLFRFFGQGRLLGVVFLASLLVACATRSSTAPAEAVGEDAAESVEDSEGSEDAGEMHFEVEEEMDEPDEVDRTAARWEQTGVAAPNTLAGEHLEWVLDVLEDGGAVPDLDEITGRFSEAFREQVQPRQLVATFRQLAPMLGPFRLEQIESEQGERQLVGVLVSEDLSYWRIIVGLEPEAEGNRVETLLIQQAPDLEEVTMHSWEEVVEALDELGPRAQLLAAELGDSAACAEVAAHRAGERMPIGSTFKVWVLGALAEAVAEGRDAWEDPLAVRGELRSIPTGTMQDEEPGAEHPLRHFAEVMIRISDNTATDHLIHHLGRERVEAFLEQVGHGEPEVNTPMLTTREFTAMKFSEGAELRETFLAADEQERRAILAEDPVDFDVMEALMASEWTEPRFIDELEWFASAHDMCRTMAYLREKSTDDEAWQPVLELLGLNPGLPFDRERWPYVGYKGGSEPGAMSLHWLLLRDDERWFTLHISVADPENALDEAQVLRAAGAAIQQMGEIE